MRFVGIECRAGGEMPLHVHLPNSTPRLLFGLSARERHPSLHGRSAADSPPHLAGRRRAPPWRSPGRRRRWVAAKLAGETLEYDYVSSGVVKGSQTTVRMPDGSRQVRFEFTDRGRGPKVRSTIAVDGAGLISNLHTTGYNYMKVTVNERFAVRDGKATWTNAAERETHANTPPRFYPSMDGTPEEGAVMVRAAMRAPNATVQLWPSGSTAVSKVKTLTVSSGGTSERVTMYEATGLDFSPVPLWLDENGELFMSGSLWGAVIRSGWKAALPQLFDAQNERTAELGRQIARTLPQRSATAIAITGVTLFDSPASEAACRTRRSSFPARRSSPSAAPRTSVPGRRAPHRRQAAGRCCRACGTRTCISTPASVRAFWPKGVTTIRDPGNAPEYIAKTQGAVCRRRADRSARHHRRTDGRHRQVHRADRNDDRHGGARPSSRCVRGKRPEPCRSRSTAR